MKKVIDGKVYNTDTAELIAEWNNSYYWNDFNFCSEELYRTKKGKWFLYGEGGPMSKYSEPVGDNGRSGGEDIEPLGKEEVIEILERWNEADKLEEHFPDYLEEA